MENKFEPLLSMLYGYYGIVDKKSNLIKECYKEHEVFCQNCDLQRFLDMFEDREHLDPTSYDRKMLIPWVLKNTKEKEVAVSIATLDTKEKKYKIRLYDDLNGDLYYFISKPGGNNQTFNLFDKLTRIYLREGIETLVRNEIESKNPRPFSIIIIDVDNFKTINDMYGHLFGDHILKTIASMLKDYSSDCNVGRIGGDEFLIQDFTSQEYEAVWTKMHNLLERIRNFDYVSTYTNDELEKVKLVDFKCTVTAGIVSFPKDGETYDSLFLKADKALYRGKRKGRNCYIIYVEEKHKNICVDKAIEFDSPISRETLIYEKLIYNGLSIFEKDQPIEQNLKEYLDLFGKYIIADRIVLYEHYAAFNDRLVAFYANPNIERASLDYVQKEILETEESKTMDLNKTYKRSKIESLIEIKPNLYNFLAAQNVKSFYQLPISKNGILYGFLRFDSVLEEHKWKEEEVTLYQIMARTISNYINVNIQKFDNEMSTDKDPLTGLPAYKTSVEKITSILSRDAKKYALGVTNLYKFKLFNDSFGYSSGDNILRILAHTLSYAKFYYVGRLNGDHFVFLIDSSEETCLKDKINDLFKEFNKNVSGLPGSDLLRLHAGVYITDGSESNSRACIDKARNALLKINEKKDNNYLIYDSKLNEEFIKQRNILNEFKVDIKKNKLEVFLQPKINARTNELVGAEALSRWRRGDDAYWTPNKYIQVLEQENELATLDIYNIEQVLIYLDSLKEDNKKMVPISVNLSKHQTNILDFAIQIEELRKRYDVEPKYLQIEITETSFEDNYDETFSAIRKLKDLGYTICMDDFGVGYSNLGLLASGLFDIIKFDKTIVTKKDRLGKVVFKSSVELVHNLGLKMVFEGVETKEDVDYVLNSGGEVIQGYYFSCPISIDDFNKKYIK